MFGIGLPELILIMVVGLIVFGPGKLPEVGRALGKGLREFKKAQNALTAAMNEPDPPKQQAPAQAVPVQPQPAQATPPAATQTATIAPQQNPPQHPAFPDAAAAAPAASVAAQPITAAPVASSESTEPTPAAPPQELHLEAKPTTVAADYHTPTQEEVRAQLAAQQQAQTIPPTAPASRG